ncbi:hypothetical protein AB4037_23245 [Labrys sp. KB_33_2]|uniref:hypothetical protein n=1 Tax=Labrys sp. KB_33_2 TaxID=3237479 RepID=UPI003F8EE77E
MPSEHTPTPWEAEPEAGRGAWIKGTSGEWAALSCGDTDESARANAALIVAAVNTYAPTQARVAELEAEVVRLWEDRDNAIRLAGENADAWQAQLLEWSRLREALEKIATKDIHPYVQIGDDPNFPGETIMIPGEYAKLARAALGGSDGLR